jgi:putative transposase
VAGMKWLLGTYTIRYNVRHRLRGHLFAGRYKSIVVDPEDPYYLRVVCDYVHLNPVRAKLLQAEQKLEEYEWSSYGEYLKPQGKRKGFLRVDRLLGEHGFKDNRLGRMKFAEGMEKMRMIEGGKELDVIRRGWHLGGEEFKAKLLDMIQEKLGENHRAEERQESEEQKAERIVREELKRMKWGEEDLERQLKGHRNKVQIAKRLRDKTLVSLKWIANRLKMGTWTHVSNRLYAVKSVNNKD